MDEVLIPPRSLNEITIAEVLEGYKYGWTVLLEDGQVKEIRQAPLL